MSKLRLSRQNQKEIKFSEWMDGSVDPYLGNLEMQPQKVKEETREQFAERIEDYAKMNAALYDTEKNKGVKAFTVIYQISSVIWILMLIGVMLLTVSHLPPNGNPDNPANNEVPKRYIENGLQETGAVNIVTGMILDYRAFDTFGESNVLFIATVTVLILLRKNRKMHNQKDAKEDQNDEKYEPVSDGILRSAAKVLVPVIFVFGLYVILNGHLGPGGGFSGGAIMGAGLILYCMTFGFEKTERFFTEKTFKWISFTALTVYCLSKAYSFYTGANGLHSHIPLGTPGAILSSGLIFVLNICVGMVVTCTMYTFYAMFRKGEF
ncbi:MAG: hypothetical protein K6E16_08545 [Lachnospiraceae bacterium]|nr:hypothetical protein [Lachnospiraceae bacterium]